MKKKILYAITKGNWGGAQKYVFELAQAMKEEGYEVSVLCGEPGILEEKLKQENIGVFALPSMKRDINLFEEIESFRDLIHYFRKERPEILHLNSSKMGALGALAARIARVPKIVFTAHGWAFNEDRPLYYKLIIKFLSWITILLSDHTIVLSQKEFNQVSSWIGTRNKVTIIPIGIRPITTLTDKGVSRELITQKTGIPLSSSDIIFGTLAELHTNKGLQYCIEALSKIDPSIPFKYFVFGEGEERHALQELITEKRLTGSIFLSGFQKNASSLLPAFDLFILPSIKEGLPYTILEAGFAGLPVIATNVGGIPEIIKNGETGILVSPKDTRELSEKITLLASDGEKRQRYGSNLREKIINDFSFKKLIEKTIRLYEL